MKRAMSSQFVVFFVLMTGVLVVLAGGCKRDPPGPVELWVGGDIHLGDRAAGGLDPLSSALSGASGIINLEGPIGDAPTPGEGVRLVNAPSSVAALYSAGVRVAGIANNHAADRGPQGPSETAAALRAGGVLPAGGPAGPAVLTIHGTRVVITAHDLGGGVPAGLSGELMDARALGDVLLSTFHVTGPPSYLPRPELRAAVEIALAAGARVIAAHGTHALGPVERRGGAVIAWGLGNLLFACDCTDDVDGLILRVSIDRDEVRARIIPIDAGLRGGAARDGHNPGLILDLLDALGSSPLRREAAAAAF
jgi:hypothetical protein